MLIHDEPMAGILKSVFEGFANGRFDSIAAIVRYLEAMPDFPRDGRGLIRYSRVKNILTHPIYAGMVMRRRGRLLFAKASMKPSSQKLYLNAYKAS